MIVCKYSCKATALFRRSSFDEKRKVTLPFLTCSTNPRTATCSASSSRKYRLLNSTHLSGSWLYHFRSSFDGATVFSQISIFASFFDTPRGQSLSTNILNPSVGCGFSYTRFIEILISLLVRIWFESNRAGPSATSFFNSLRRFRRLGVFVLTAPMILMLLTFPHNPVQSY